MSFDKYLEQLSPVVKNKINDKVSSALKGLGGAAPLLCRGPEKCKIIEFCPVPETVDGEIVFGDLSDYPINQTCVLERLYLEARIVELRQHLGVEAENPIENGIVNELALLDLYKQRSVMLLSRGRGDSVGGDLLITDIKNFNENGTAAVDTKLNPLLEYIDKAERRRLALLDRLLETRAAQAKLFNRSTPELDMKLLIEIQQLRKAFEEQNVITVKPERLLLSD